MSLVKDSILYYDIYGQWEQCYVTLDEFSLLQVYERVRTDLPPSISNRASVIAEFTIEAGQCDVKSTTLSLAAMSKLLKSKVIPATPCFFNISVKTFEGNAEKLTTKRFCAASYDLRKEWIDTLKRLCTVKSTDRSYKGKPHSSPSNKYISSPSPSHPAILSVRPQGGLLQPPPRQKSSEKKSPTKNAENDLYEHKDHPDNQFSSDEANAEGFSMGDMYGKDEGDSDVRLLGTIKVASFLHLFQCISAYPFALISLIFKFSQNKDLYFTRSLAFIRVMNGLLFFAVPVILVDLVLQTFYSSSWIQRLTIGLYCLALSSLVVYMCSMKVLASASTSLVEEGTFSFKPSRRARWTLANAIAISGYVLDWLFTCTMVLPLGVIGIVPKEATISAVPPYLPYSVYFWTAFTLVFLCSFIIILNASLRGKSLYSFQKSKWVWYSFNVVGGPFFMTIVIILLMSLHCDYSGASRHGQTPITLLADPFIRCYSNRGIMLARAGLIALGIYFTQFSLLPIATFKESMLESLDIIFVPVYSSMQNVMNLAFCFFYVFFYQDETARVVVLSLINFGSLGVAMLMKPCSISWINIMRECMLFHASLCSIHSLNLLAWQNAHSTQTLLLSTLVSTAVFVTVLVITYHLISRRNTEFAIAKSLLEIEYEVSKNVAGCVSPRVLEDLIAATQSSDKSDWAIAKKYVGQLVWLLKYPNMRVQFQVCWALANIALLDEESRLKILEAGGAVALFEGYPNMQAMAQLECLAALANLSLSPAVADELAKQGNFIGFLMSLLSQHKVMHCVFAVIAIGNLARKEVHRNTIRRCGGVQALVGCIMSQNYQKRKYGMFALANMALSPTKEVHQLFATPGLVDRILKMAARNEIETQREVITLIRNLATHSKLRPILLDRGVVIAVSRFHDSLHEYVIRTCEELNHIMERELASPSLRSKNDRDIVDPADVEALKKIEPLDGRVDWATWGSKLDLLFDSMFISFPRPVAISASTSVDNPQIICLKSGLTKNLAKKWQDSMTFVITAMPTNGTLTELRPGSSLWTYGPNPGFSGKDSFSYRIFLGANVLPTAYCSITVEQFLEHSKVYEMDDDTTFELRRPAKESDYFNDENDNEEDDPNKHPEEKSNWNQV